MKKSTFDIVINNNLEKYINCPIDELAYLEDFYNNPLINVENYYRWRSASMLCFGIHYYSFWYNPNEKDFKAIIDAFTMTYIAQAMYLFDEKKKFVQTLVVGVPLFLAILTFGKEREIDFMFHIIVSLIRDSISKKNSIDHQDKTLQEAFLLYDLYTNGKNRDVWQPYITKSLDRNYQQGMNIILSDNEDEVNSILVEMMKYHKKKSRIESFVTNEFYSVEWCVFPIEIIALIRFRYLHGRSIDFINDEVLSKFVPYLKEKDYYLSPAIEKAKNEMYKLSFHNIS